MKVSILAGAAGIARAAAITSAATLMVWGTTSAFAGSVLQPGGTVGLPAGAPLPEGVYFINTSSYGQRTSTQSGLNVNLTQVVWATPFSFYDTRLQFVVLQPTNGTTGTTADQFYANSLLGAAQLAHTFGNGFGASYQAGFRTPEPSALAFHQGSFEQRGAVTYNAFGFDLTANVINGIFYEGTPAYPNWLNVDLTATKKFDKLEIGVVAFGSGDISKPTAAYLQQRQIAVGGLAGYNFGSFALQAYVTRDVYERHYTGYDTRGFLRLILPLYKAPVVAQIEPIRARY